MQRILQRWKRRLVSGGVLFGVIVLGVTVVGFGLSMIVSAKVPGVQLVERSIKRLPGGVERVVFAESGLSGFYPAVVSFSSDEVRFLDPAGGTRAVVTKADLGVLTLWKECSVSPSGKYVGIVGCSESDLMREDLDTVRIEVRDVEGRRLWRYDTEDWKAVGPPYMLVSDDGSAVGIAESSGDIFFFDRFGEVVAEREFYPGVGFGRPRVLGAVSPDGGYVAIYWKYGGTREELREHRSNCLDDERVQTMINNWHTLALFTMDGRELWRVFVDEGLPDLLEISPRGSYVAISVSRTGYVHEPPNSVDIYTRDGALLCRYLARAMHLGFSSDEKYVAFDDWYSGCVRILELEGCVEVGKYSLPLWRKWPFLNRQSPPDYPLVEAGRLFWFPGTHYLGALVATYDYTSKGAVLRKLMLEVLDETGVVRSETELDGFTFDDVYSSSVFFGGEVSSRGPGRMALRLGTSVLSYDVVVGE